MNFKWFSVLLTTTLSLLFASYQVEDYSVDELYLIQFSTTKAEGNFYDLKGEINFNPMDLGRSKIDVWVEAGSIKTGNNKKDKHARGRKWFDAKSYPTIKFKSNRFEKADEGFKVVGQFYIKDKVVEETIAFTYDLENGQYVLNGTGEVNRLDCGVEGNAFGFVVGKEVALSLKAPAQFSE